MAVDAGLERRVAAALRRSGYTGSHKTLVVAVSGGPDSLALLYSLHRLKAPLRPRLHVAHLNHNFRGEEADEDARFVASVARELDLPATVEKQDPVQDQRERGISSFEQAAREIRYAFLSRGAEDVGAPAVAVGHTADDQAETVMLHVMRGSGLHGLAGMAELSPWPWPGAGDQLRLFRPLLGVTKADTLAYCRELNRDFREDSGNYMPEFTRNRVRQHLMPLLASEYNPQIRESLLRLARTATLDLEYLESEASQVWSRIAVEVDGGVRFNLAALAALHPALQRMLLRRGYSELTGDARRLRESHLAAMTEMVSEKGTGRVVSLPRGLRLHRSYDYLLLSRDESLPCLLPLLPGEHALTLPPAEGQESVSAAGGWRVTLRVAESNKVSFEKGDQATPVAKGGRAGILPSDLVWYAWLDRAALGGQLLVRTRRPGDRFRPLGMSQAKKLQDFFTGIKVPRAWRDRVPLLVSDQGIAWVVGYRIADWAAVQVEGSPVQPAVRGTFEAQV